MTSLYININKISDDLRDADLFSKNDLFVVVKYGGEERRTNVKWNENKPCWNEAFIFEYVELERTIICEIYDHNMWSPSQRLAVEMFDVNMEEPQVYKGNYLEVKIGNLWFKNKVKFDLLNLKNQKLKQEINVLKEEDEKFIRKYNEYKSLNNEFQDEIAELTRELNFTNNKLVTLQKEHKESKAIYDKATESNIIIVAANDELANKNEQITKKNEGLLKENIALNEENIALFDKLESIKLIVNQNVNLDNN